MEGFVAKYGKLGAGFSRREIADSFEHPGRRVDGSQSAASWISDLTALQKVIILCSFCRSRFNPRKNHYRRYYVPDSSGRTDGYAVNGKCFACKQITANCGGGTAFIHEATYNLVCQDPIEARRKARAAAGEMSVWRAVRR